MSWKESSSHRLTLLLVLLALSSIASTAGWMRGRDPDCGCMEEEYSLYFWPRAHINLWSGETKTVLASPSFSGPLRWSITEMPSAKVVREVDVAHHSESEGRITLTAVDPIEREDKGKFLPRGPLPPTVSTQMTVLAEDLRDLDGQQGRLTIRGRPGFFLGYSTAELGKPWLSTTNPEGFVELTVWADRRGPDGTVLLSEAIGDWDFTVYVPSWGSSELLEETPQAVKIGGPNARITFRMKQGSDPSARRSVPVIVTARSGNHWDTLEFRIDVHPTG